VRDVSGYIVTPGLIDLHTHVYWGGTSLGIDAEEFCRTSGVTTAVDTGSAGPGNFAGFRKHVIEPSQVRILAYLHVSHAGIFGYSHRVMVGESEEIRLMNPIDAVTVAEQNRDLIVGIKVRVGLHSSGTSGIVPLEIALEVAEQVGMPLMAHIDHPPPSYEDRAEASLHRGPALGRAGAGARSHPQPDHPQGRRAEPDQSTQRMPLPHPLSIRVRSLPDGGTGASVDRRRSVGGVSSRSAARKARARSVIHVRRRRIGE